MKKFLSTVLALVMALSLCVPAFAADQTIGLDGLAEGATVEVTGTTETATVQVLVPTDGTVVLNPYGLSVTVDSAQKTDQIISAPQYIVNKSNLPVKVTTKVTGTIEGGGDFAAADATAETTKKVHLEFNIGKTSDNATESTSYETHPLVKGTAVDFADIVMDKDGDAEPAVSYKFTGDAATNPTTPWTTDDIIGATIVFTFALDNSGAGGGGGSSVTATITEASSKTSIGTGETASLTVALSGGKTIDSVTWSADDSGANVSLGGSTNATETVSWVSAGGSVTITATVTYDTDQTATATFTLGTT